MKPASIKAWLGNESGAITVDWVVLSAAVVGLGVASVGAVRSGTSALGGDIQTSLSSAGVAALGALGTNGVAPYQHTLLYASSSLYSSWIAAFSGWPDSNVLTMYDFYSTTAAQYIADGNMTNAAYYIDLAYAMQQTMVNRGGNVPDSGAAIPVVVAQYHAAQG